MLKDLKERIISQGVKNLQEYGYKDSTSDNITTDPIYREFFKSMLADNLGKGADKSIKELLEA